MAPVALILLIDSASALIQLHVIPPGLHDLECIPFLDTKQAPDDEMVVAVNSLCMGGRKIRHGHLFKGAQVHPKLKLIHQINMFISVEVADEKGVTVKNPSTCNTLE